ncbi:MAG: nuclear transport factor 2 family protein [Hyphomonas sp.]|nr:nuclear transport factor 2 family protein [Hyphomonas sp.]
MKALAAAVSVFALAACATQAGAPAPVHNIALDDAAEMAAITGLLEAQDAAWNRGDIDAFMDGYWKSPLLRFASGGKVTRGWDDTNARYHTTYGTPEKMGKLITSDYEIVLLSPDAAVAHGRWKLERDGDEPSGLYTLILRKFGGDWKIVSDTTTSAG